jgi:hypothetical protein
MNIDESEVYDYLVDIAKNGFDVSKDDSFYSESGREELRERQIIVTYDDVLNYLELESNSRPELFTVLDKINKRTQPINLSSIVVNGAEFLPGDGFFKKWVPTVDFNDDEAKISSWKKELERVWDHYSDKNTTPAVVTDNKTVEHTTSTGVYSRKEKQTPSKPENEADFQDNVIQRSFVGNTINVNSSWFIVIFLIVFIIILYLIL